MAQQGTDRRGDPLVELRALPRLPPRMTTLPERELRIVNPMADGVTSDFTSRRASISSPPSSARSFSGIAGSLARQRRPPTMM